MNRSLLTALTATAALALPSIASANDFCVDAAPGCNGTQVASGSIDTAVAAAQSNGTDDRFLFPSGTITVPAISYNSLEKVEFIGAGIDKTIVRAVDDGAAVLEVGGNSESTVSDLTVQPSGLTAYGLELHGTKAVRTRVSVGATPNIQVAAWIDQGASFSHGEILGNQANGIVIPQSAGTVTDSTIEAPNAYGVVAVGKQATVRRTKIKAFFGVLQADGHLTLTDSFIDVRGQQQNAAAVVTSTEAGLPVTSLSADIERNTIVGSTPNTAESAGIAAGSDGAGKTVDVHVRDTIVTGFCVPFLRLAQNSATVDITTNRSADPSAVSPIYDQGDGAITETGRLAVNPHFVDPTHGDFHLAPDSPLIDAGTPGSTTDDARDLDGNTRASDGNGDCSIISDVGAYELQGASIDSCNAVPASPGPTPPPAPAPTPAPAQPAPLAITSLKVAPKRVKSGSVLPKRVAKTPKRPLSSIDFALSRRATIELRFTKLSEGARVTRIKTRLRVRGTTGANHLRFAARLTRKARLKPGSYRVTAVATDGTGSHSAKKSARFKVIRRAAG